MPSPSDILDRADAWLVKGLHGIVNLLLDRQNVRLPMTRDTWTLLDNWTTLLRKTVEALRPAPEDTPSS